MLSPHFRHLFFFWMILSILVWVRSSHCEPYSIWMFADNTMCFDSDLWYMLTKCKNNERDYMHELTDFKIWCSLIMLITDHALQCVHQTMDYFAFRVLYIRISFTIPSCCLCTNHHIYFVDFINDLWSVEQIDNRLANLQSINLFDSAILESL